MSTVSAWIRAARLPSQSYIALPLLFGQLAAWGVTGSWSWPVFVLVQMFGLFDQLFIVFANDVADRETDAANETATIFSGGSRVLADGSLQPRQLSRAAWAMAGGCVAVSGMLFVMGASWGLPVLALAALLLLWMYSFPPVALSYRGGGELLQAAGVGIVLPCYGYLAQAGHLSGFDVRLLAAIVPTQLACAVATSLPDVPSDAASGKRTAAVAFGPRWAKALIFVLNAGAVAHLVVLSPAGWTHAQTWAAVAVPALATLALPLVGPSPPGSRRINVYVFLAILATLSLMVGASVLVVS